MKWSWREISRNSTWREERCKGLGGKRSAKCWEKETNVTVRPPSPSSWLMLTKHLQHTLPLLADDAPWGSCVSAHFTSRGTDCLCSRPSFQDAFTEMDLEDIMFLSTPESRFPCSPLKRIQVPWAWVSPPSHKPQTSGIPWPSACHRMGTGARERA